MKFSLRIVIICILSICICNGIYRVFSSGLINYYQHTTNRLTEIVESDTYYDILFIGSSRTHTSINPKIIDVKCAVNSYNAGVEGGNLFEFKMIFDAYLVNHPAPKMLVLTLDLTSFKLDHLFFNHTQYFPYLDNPVIESTLNTNGHSTWVIKLFPFLNMTEFDDYVKGNAIKGLVGTKERDIPEGDFEYKGFMSNTTETITDTAAYVGIATNQPISYTAIDYLNDIVRVCQEKNIKLVFTYAPEFNFKLQKQTTNTKQIIDLITDIASKNSITYFKDDTLTLCSNPALFANFGHLNKKGANEYSLVFSERMCEAMLK